MRTTSVVVLMVLSVAAGASAQARGSVTAPAPPASSPSSSAAPAAGSVPPGYVIGPEDVLSIIFWRDKDMSADVVVRPDGKVSLPLLNDIDAAGLTPEQLREELVKRASKYVEDPNASVVVKEIHSRKVFITGNVAKPGSYSLAGEMNVMQLIALAGGLQEYADSKNIVVMRMENGRQVAHRVNYKDIVKQKHVEQNIQLRSGDTVIVP